MSNELFLSRITSSLEKCFIDDPVELHPVMEKASMLRNERFSFQLVCRDLRMIHPGQSYIKVEIDSPLADALTLRTVEQMATMMPVYVLHHDDNYLRTQPGLYPDLLLPLRYGGQLRTLPNVTCAMWVDVEKEGGLPAGTHPITIRLTDAGTGELLAENTLQLTVVAADLPKQTTLCTQWFHSDCLASYYNVEVFSEEHWRIIENFVRMAAKNGQNMLLTPIVTPPLDTKVGGERPTVQLLDITLNNGEYSFGFERFDRWVEMAHRCGITHFEIAHLFTQWGAAHAPKVMATVDGEYKRIFGWDTDAIGPEYTAYLNAMLPALIAHLRELGIADNCVFHISDEPNPSVLDAYMAARNIAAPLLKGFTVMDALSNVEFYKSGAVEHPVPANNHIEPFLAENIPDLWTYYCCSQNTDVANRFVAMPAYRNRVLGVQMYKHNIVGFLQWGYNFYYSQYSCDQLEPYAANDGYGFAPAGDTYIVYPGQNGTPNSSMRLPVFADVFQDIRALQLCEQLIGRDAVLAMIEEGCDEPLSFSKYPHDAAWLLNLREKVNAAIAANI
ncbi:MAG: DUF4091 domain-containing protein [Clostridia bacterium]|nr:DUF4091 domain-containing protein [Clostridia bacterium]